MNGNQRITPHVHEAQAVRVWSMLHARTEHGAYMPGESGFPATASRLALMPAAYSSSSSAASRSMMPAAKLSATCTMDTNG